MRKTTLLWILPVLWVSAGCTQQDENPHWRPAADYPGWAYDGPIYYRPSEDLQAKETVGHGIGVYYSRSEYFFLRHPNGYQVVGEPRVAVWCSTDDGKHWGKCGYYGVEQTHFLFKAEKDGPHWIRFVGPGQGVAEVPPGMPHRIYIVDRRPPTIALTVIPAPWKDDEKKEPYIYKTGETVTLNWSVSDANLQEGSVKLGTCFAKFPHNLVWSRFHQPLPPRGTMKVEIPPEAAGDGGLRFRMEATDKAGNVGMALTDVMQVRSVPGAATRPAIGSAGVFETVAEAGEEEKPGWPMPGAMLRGGTARVLNWTPDSARDYAQLELQFTANNGLSWRTIAGDLKVGEKAKWTVPSVTSKDCRLRIVGVSKTGERIMLAMTQRFIVDTVVPDTEMGPAPLPPGK
ncbi:MAG TPA: hypothetical protein PK082_03510 [Phycisphaerae bacterium]|nr:hypothetical protein [Phycisphaerae bacterium]